jgi:hypothetical protein
MVQAYNFLSSWQLFPEKCDYQKGIAPKSGIYKIETSPNGKLLSISSNWVTVDNEACYTQFNVTPDGNKHAFENAQLAAFVVGTFVNASAFELQFLDASEALVLVVSHEILPNGFLKITTINHKDEFTNIEIYHKQMSVLPYASSVGSVAIKPTKEGVIKHKALSAMEEQTNMQLNQIKEQIELLARQAQDLRKRKELSLMIYEAKLSFNK